MPKLWIDEMKKERMGILKFNFKLIRLALLSVFTLLCGLSFYTNINKIAALIIGVVLIAIYILVLDNPKNYDSLKGKVQKGIIVILTVFLLLMFFQIYEPLYFSSRIDNYLFLILSFIPLEFSSTIKSNYRETKRQWFCRFA